MSRIIIVGGGPAGSMAALSLAREGLDVLLLEKAQFPRDKACGEFISPLGVYCLAEVGLLDSLIAAGATWVDHAQFVLPGGGSRAAAFDANPHSPTPLRGLSLSRRILDAMLLQAAEDAGAEVRQGVLVQQIERGPEGRWRVEGRVSRGEVFHDDGDLLVGADGVMSVVARRMDWLRPAWPQRMGITATFRHLPVEPGRIEMHIGSAGYCGVVSQSEGASHVGLAFTHKKGESAGGSSLEERLLHEMARFPGLRKRVAAAEIASPVKAFGPMAMRVTQRTGDRVMLIGDAAGFLDPFTGHGIGFALRSACLAADVILRAVRCADYRDAFLVQYSVAYARETAPTLRFFRGLQRLLAIPKALHPGVERLILAIPGLMEASIRFGATASLGSLSMMGRVRPVRSLSPLKDEGFHPIP